MNTTEWQSYLIPIGFVVFIATRVLKFRAARKKLPTLLNEGAVIVDVRSRGEFAGGAAKGSINIPLDELERGAEKLDPAKPVIVCCASGTRSAMGAQLLKRKGFQNVTNVGPWRNAVPSL